MVNFDYMTPTRLIFGKDSIEKLPEVMNQFGPKILLTYGGGSIKKIGLYDKVSFPLAVRFNQDGQQLAFLATDDLLDRTAHRRGQEDVCVLFVCNDGGAAEHGIPLLDEQSRKETLEVRRLDGHNARRYRL